MKPALIPSTAIISLFLLISLSLSRHDDRVHIRDVGDLIFFSGDKTTGRRSRPVQQLECVGTKRKFCKEADITSLLCSPIHSGYGDPNWRCEAPHLPSYFKIAKVDVNCEGYDYPDDEYILKGSCGARYTLGLTAEGKEKYGSDGSSIGRVLFYLIIFLIIFAVAWSILTSMVRGTRNAVHRVTRLGGGGGGYGGAPGDYPGGNQGYNNNQGGYPKFSTYQAPSTSGWWNFGMGGMLGYLIGRSRSGASYYSRNAFRRTGGGFGGGHFSSGRSSGVGFGRTSRR